MRPIEAFLLLVSLLLVAATPLPTPPSREATATPTPEPTHTAAPTATPPGTPIVILSSELFWKELERQNNLLENTSNLGWASLFLTAATLLVLLATALINKQLARSTQSLAKDTADMAKTASCQFEATMQPWVIPRRLKLFDGKEPHIMGIQHWLQNHSDALALECVSKIDVIQVIGDEEHKPRLDAHTRNLFVPPHSEEMTTTLISWPKGTNWRALLASKDDAGQFRMVLRLVITSCYKSPSGKRYWTESRSQYHADVDNFFVLEEKAGKDNGGDQPATHGV